MSYFKLGGICLIIFLNSNLPFIQVLLESSCSGSYASFNYLNKISHLVRKDIFGLTKDNPTKFKSGF